MSSLVRANLTAGAILLASAAFAASTLAAQEWRTLEARRTRVTQGQADTLHVRLAYGAGKLTLRAAPEPLLYDLRMHYDANERRANYHYDGATHTLTVGGDSGVTDLFSLRRRHDGSKVTAERSSLVLGVASGAPVDLALEFSAAEAAIDLSELHLTHLRIETAASDSRIVFGTPNRSRIPTIELHATAAGLAVAQLGNAHADTVRATATMGHMDLDLSGEWTGEKVLDLRAVMGAVTVRVPRDIGVRVIGSRVLGGIDTPGFAERGGAYYSDNWESATRRLMLEGRAVMAGIEVIRTD